MHLTRSLDGCVSEGMMWLLSVVATRWPLVVSGLLASTDLRSNVLSLAPRVLNSSDTHNSKQVRQ
jgi:hypothetical protein